MTSSVVPKTLEELSALLDLLAEKHVAEFSIGDLSVTMLQAVEVEEPVEERTAPPPAELEEERNKTTGLTKAQEEELFYSSR